jgi:peptidoglycan hydrolase-like protein with peptidoglycan-binding domain
MRGEKGTSGGRFSPHASKMPGGEPGRPRRGPRPLPLVIGAGAVVIAGVVVVVVAGSRPDGETASADGRTPTTTIERRDLVEVQTEDGTLGYADSRTLVNRMAGTVTWLPRTGSVVRTDGRLYTVDGKAVYLLDGSSPAYRDLEPGISGADVGALERNLRALGKDPAGAMTVDRTWDAGTTAAVKRWQHDKGLEETGTIELGRVVFAPGARRVSSHELKVGASAGQGSGGGSDSDGGGDAPANANANAARSGGDGSDSGRGGDGGSAADSGDDADAAASAPSTNLMRTTSTRRIVTVKLDTTKESVAVKGARVTVELPSGDAVHGRIARIGTTATSEQSSDGSSSPPTIKLTIRLTERAKAIDQAPVTVRLERSRSRDVLAIPVTALMARSGGRFAVEVVEGAKRRTVPVTTGLFTSGYVEIDGSGLRPGMRVANAAV